MALLTSGKNFNIFLCPIQTEISWHESSEKFDQLGREL